MHAVALLKFAAAISLAEPLDECAARVGRGVYGASNTLEKQIREGAPVAVFVSASREAVDRLENDGKVVAGSRRVFATGELVLVAPVRSGAKSPPQDVAALVEGAKRVAWGDPALVPAGKYAVETMRALGLLEKLEAKRVLAKDVRQVLAYVESGDADAGWVYRTDALASKKARIVWQAPSKLHAPIEYVLARVAPGPEAEKLSERLLSNDCREALERHGFGVAAKGAQ